MLFVESLVLQSSVKTSTNSTEQSGSSILINLWSILIINGVDNIDELLPSFTSEKENDCVFNFQTSINRMLCVS